MNDPLLVGVDLGTTSCKAAVFLAISALLGTGSSPCAVNRPAPGWVEQDPEDYWRSARDAIRQALAGIDASRVVGVACCGHTPSLVLVDARGKPVRPALTWQDTRAAAEAAALEREVSGEQWRAWLGMDLPRNASYPPARLRWLRTHEPESLARARRLLQPKDFVNLRLTGLAASDYWSNKGIAHLATGAPIAAYKDLLGVDPALAPPCRYPHQPLGPLSPGAAAELGLPAGIPVASGWSDAMAGMLGTGALAQEGLGFDIAGTSEIAGLTARHAPATAPGVLLVPILDTDLRIVYGPTQTSGAALTWFLQGFYADEEMVARTNLNALSAASADGLIFLPYLEGERAPIWDTAARGVFFRVSAAHTRSHFLRAVLEGVAFSVRHVLDAAELAAGTRVAEVRVSGGGSRSPFWNQIKADVLGRPLRPTAGSDAGVLGAAMLAGLAAGLFPDLRQASAAMVRLGHPIMPTPAAVEAYQRLYDDYRELYRALRPLFPSAG